MRKHIKRSRKAGMPPGSLINLANGDSSPSRIILFALTDKGLVERHFDDFDSYARFDVASHVRWVDIDGLASTNLIEALGKKYNIHALSLEDILNPSQRPKAEEYDNHLYVVARMLYFKPDSGEFVSEQISLIVCDGVILSFQEKGGDVFDKLRERLRKETPQRRFYSTDYLLYSLLDLIVDHYFAVLEEFGEQIETLETALVNDPSPESLARLHHYKTEMIYLRRSVWPMREVINMLQHSDASFIRKETRPFFNDLYDHIVSAIESVEIMREILSEMLDIYLSSVSQRMNQVVKVLTVISTIFMPLTFLVGVYGMNFDYMPELRSRWGYPAVWVVMLTIAIAMLGVFRRKKWI